MITPTEFKKAQQEFFDERNKAIVNNFVERVLFRMHDCAEKETFSNVYRYSFELEHEEVSCVIGIVSRLIELGWNVSHTSPEPYGKHYVVINTLE